MSILLASMGLKPVRPQDPPNASGRGIHGVADRSAVKPARSRAHELSREDGRRRKTEGPPQEEERLADGVGSGERCRSEC